MKIALLTIHWANNYGASLQTYATVKVLQAYGEVTLLDYRSYYPSKGMDLIRYGGEFRDILRAAKDVFRIIPRYKVIKEFKQFTRRMPLSPRIESSEDFLELEKQFDCFVCGSDQIWNPDIVGNKGGFDSRYLLDFVRQKKKISYSSSIGNYKFNDKQKVELAELLCSFAALSMREADAAKYVSEFVGNLITPVLDPTLLLTAEEWRELVCGYERPRDKYILVYALIKDAELKEVVDHYRKMLGLKVVAIDQDPFINYRADAHLKDVSPEGYVGLFSGAEFVITNSFHGVCFCINFNKNFHVTKPMGSPNRITCLLDSVGLEDRFRMKCGDNFEVNYDQPNIRLAQLRQSSKGFLEKSLDVGGDFAIPEKTS